MKGLTPGSRYSGSRGFVAHDRELSSAFYFASPPRPRNPRMNASRLKPQPSSPQYKPTLQGVYGNLFPMIMRGGPGTSSPGQISFKNASFRSILMSAYGLKQHQISGPQWIQTTGFNIEAKLPRVATKEEIKVMLRNLLAERFKLEAHRETREIPVFALVVGKDGPKLAAPKDPEGGGVVWSMERERPVRWRRIKLCAILPTSCPPSWSGLWWI